MFSVQPSIVSAVSVFARRFVFLLFAASTCLGALTIAGCSTPSLQPLYAQDKSDTVELKELVGVWQEKDNATRYEILAGAENLYVLTITKADGHESEESLSAFDVYLVKVGQTTMADLSPRESERNRMAERYGTAALALHVPLKIELRGDELRVWQTGSKAEGLIEADQALCPSATSGDLRLLTGNTPQVRALLEKHSTNEDFWGSPMVLARRK